MQPHDVILVGRRADLPTSSLRPSNHSTREVVHYLKMLTHRPEYETMAEAAIKDAWQRCTQREPQCASAWPTRSANGGLIVTSGILTTIHREVIVTLAGRHRLPAVYPGRYFVDGGGLISYGADFSDHFRGAASYVDRILRGEKPADLPVQTPTKYELVINLKAAKALGLTVPAALLVRADEVIE